MFLVLIRLVSVCRLEPLSVCSSGYSPPCFGGWHREVADTIWGRNEPCPQIDQCGLPCVSHPPPHHNIKTSIKALTLWPACNSAFHWVDLPRFPGGPAGLYLKPMLAVLNKCVHTGHICPILTLVKYGSPYQSHTTWSICVDFRFFFYFRK